MKNKNSIAAISALIALSFAKNKSPSGNKNNYVLDSYQHELTSGAQSYHINHSWSENYNNRAKLLKQINSGKPVRIVITENGFLGERFAKEIFENIKKSKVIFIDNSNPTIAWYIKKYLLPNLWISLPSWGGGYHKSHNHIKLIRISGAELTDLDLTDVFEYSKNVQFLDLSKNNLINPNIPAQYYGYKSLLKLKLDQNPKLRSIDNIKYSCKQLVSINIEKTNIRNFPNWLTKVKTLEEVIVDSNCIFPNSVKKLTKVKKLNFMISRQSPFNRTIMNWSGVEFLEFRVYYRDLLEGPGIAQDIPIKIYTMSNLKGIKFTSWWSVIDKLDLKFRSTKNNLMNSFVCEFEKAILSGRYDHFLSKAKRVVFWSSILKKIKNPIENEVTSILSFQYSTVYLPLVYTMRNLESLSIRNSENPQDLSEIDFSYIPNLKKLTLTGTRVNKIPLDNLKNMDQLNLTSINLKNCKSANLENLNTGKRVKITIHKIDDVVKLPTLKKGKIIKEISLKNLILESISPIINANIEYLHFQNVTLLNGLNKQEELILLNNTEISKWAKSTLLNLLAKVPPKKTIRTR